MRYDADLDDADVERLQANGIAPKVAAVGARSDDAGVLDAIGAWFSEDEVYDDPGSPLTVYAETRVGRDGNVVGRKVEYGDNTVFKSQFVVLDDGSGVLTYEPGAWEDRLDALYDELVADDGC